MKLTLEDIEQGKNGDYAAQAKLIEYAKILYYGIKKRKNYFLPLNNDEDVLVDLQAKMLTQFIYDFDINKVEPGKEMFNESKAISGFFHLAIHRFIMSEIKHQNTNRQKANAESYSIDAEIPNQKGDGNKTIGDILISSALTPEKALELKETIQRYQNFIEVSFTENEKRVFKAHIEGLSYDEIAEKYSINEKQVDNAIQRAKRKIQNERMLEEKEEKVKSIVVTKHKKQLPQLPKVFEKQTLANETTQKQIEEEEKNMQKAGPKPKIDITFDEFYDLYVTKNLTQTEIAEHFDVSKATIWNTIKRLESESGRKLKKPRGALAHKKVQSEVKPQPQAEPQKEIMEEEQQELIHESSPFIITEARAIFDESGKVTGYDVKVSANFIFKNVGFHQIEEEIQKQLQSR